MSEFGSSELTEDAGQLLLSCRSADGVPRAYELVSRDVLHRPGVDRNDVRGQSHSQDAVDTSPSNAPIERSALGSKPSEETTISLLARLDAADRHDQLVASYAKDASQWALPGSDTHALHRQLSVSVGVRYLLDEIDFNEAEVEVDADRNRVKNGQAMTMEFSHGDIDVDSRVLALRFLRGTASLAPVTQICRTRLSEGEMPSDGGLADCGVSSSL